MSKTFKPGDRVRLRDSICFGTVTDGDDASAGGARASVMVAWDECEDVPEAVDLNQLELVRPPPQGWVNRAEGMLHDR